jgi:hypothetical protein
VVLFFPIFILFGILTLPCRGRGLGLRKALSSLLLGIWAGMGSASYYGKIEARIAHDGVYVAKPVFPESTLLYYVVEWGVERSFVGCFIFCTVSFLFVGFWEVSFGSTQDPSFDRRVLVFVNLAFTTSYCLWYLFTYNAEGTFKPSWTEWLG